MVGEVTVSCTQSGVRGWGLTSWFTSKEYKDVNLQDTVTNTNVIYGISLVRLFSHSQKALSHPSTLIIELNIVLVIVVFLLASGTYLLHVSPYVCVLLRFPRPEIPSVTVVLAVWWCMRIVNFRGIIFTFPHYESICVGGWHSVKMMLTLMIIKCSYTNAGNINSLEGRTRSGSTLHREAPARNGPASSASCPRSVVIVESTI